MDINIDMEALSGLVMLVAALVQVAKGIKFPSDYAPLLSIGLGIGCAAMLAAPELTYGEVAYTGIVVGLMASGLYSGAKTGVTAVRRSTK